MERVRGGPSKTDQLAMIIRDAIRHGDLAGGGLYSAQELAERFGVSRTPVREALLRLDDAGLVKIERNRGVRILSTSDDDITEIFALRLLLEPRAARIAADRMTTVERDSLTSELDVMRASVEDIDRFFAADRRFHDIILLGSGNQRLASYVSSLRDAILLHGRRSIPATREAAQIIAEHSAIAVAINDGDAEGAEASMRRHLFNTANLLLDPRTAATHQPELAQWIDEVPTGDTTIEGAG
ncbi:GntR family transcriptional regulator [Saccharopolyspora shandongensis]|uniref:GntR family transcriptional regulator n=1 Tax=Saccharopolyspora shandongensis TaxID=418495 RepID=UPI0033F2E3C4